MLFGKIILSSETLAAFLKTDSLGDLVNSLLYVLIWKETVVLGNKFSPGGPCNPYGAGKMLAKIQEHSQGLLLWTGTTLEASSAAV